MEDQNLHKKKSKLLPENTKDPNWIAGFCLFSLIKGFICKIK